MNDSEWEDMARNWIDIEEDPNIEEDEPEDAYEDMGGDHALMHEEDGKDDEDEYNDNEDLPPLNEGQSTITY